MKLDFILSSTINSSLQIAVDEIVEKSKDKNNNIIVLVPENSSVMIEKLLLLKTDALVNVAVYNFVRLLKKIDNSEQNKYLSREDGILILRKIITEKINELVCFKKSAKSLGFAETMFDTIQQFKASRVTPTEIIERAKNMGASLRIKLQDIGLLYALYQDYLQDNYLDNCDRLDLLISVVSNSEVIKNSQIYVVGFESLTSQAAELIEILSKVSLGVKVACSYIPAGLPNSHISDNEIYEKLKHIADKHNLVYNPIKKEIKRTKSFEHLAKNLYAYPHKAINSTGDINVFEGTNPKEEVEFIAKDIYTKIKRKGLMPKDVAIVCPNIESYYEYLTQIFGDYELPIYISRPEPLNSHPLFRLISDAFMCIRYGFDAENVLNFTKNVLLGFGEKCDIFENYVIKYAISRFGFINSFTLGKQFEESYNIAEEVRGGVANILVPLKEDLTNAKTVSDYLNAIIRLTEKLNIKERLNNLYQMQLALDIKSAKITEQVYKKLEDIINRLTRFLGDSEISLESFILLFSSALETITINLLPLTMQSIVCTQDYSTIIPTIKSLYVLGVLDGVIPYRKDDCGIIDDEELNSLGDEIEKKIEPTIRTINRRERFKTYNMLLLSTETLTLTYSIFNIKGEESVPSGLINQVRNLFLENELPLRLLSKNDLTLKYGSDNNNLDVYFGTLKTAEQKLLELIMQEKSGTCLMDKLNTSSLYSAIKEDISVTLQDKIDNINKPFSFENIDCARKLYFRKNTISISELEKYFNCPMQHFASYGLGLKEREEGGIKALDVGNILHLVAEKFEKQLKLINDENIDKFINKIIDSSLEETEVPQEKNALVLSIIKSEAVRLCKVLYKESLNSSFKTDSTEFVFNKDNSQVKFTGDITLVGKVDRVDIWNNFIKIIDYKTGSINVSAEDIYYGRKIQLIMYLLALKNYKNTKPGAVLYFPIHNEFADNEKGVKNLYKNSGLIVEDMSVISAIDNSLNLNNPTSNIINVSLKHGKDASETTPQISGKSDAILPDTLEGLQEYVYKLCNNAISEILDGNVTPSPLSLSPESLPCNYCPLKHSCKVEQLNASFERKKIKNITCDKVAEVTHELH